MIFEKNTYYLRYYNYQEKCPNKIFALDKSELSEIDNKNKFFKVMNYYFYRRMIGYRVSEKQLTKRIAQSYSAADRDFYYKCISNVKHLYDSNLQIKCISNPIEIEFGEFRVKGYMDLVVKNGNEYDIYVFILEDTNKNIELYKKELAHLLGRVFHSEFKRHHANIILFNLVTNSKNKIKYGGNYKELNNLLKKTTSCKSCKKKCKYAS